MPNSETSQPEVIWARLDNSTLYADGSSPCVARTKEFANGTKYIRAGRLSGTEILEWRDHDTSSEITYTGFGPCMVEKLSEDSFRIWLPDDTGNARIMVSGFTSRKDARAACQDNVDGRAALETVEVLRRSEAAVASRYIASQAEMARLTETLRQMRGWILHWQEDVAAGLRPSSESLSSALADLNTALEAQP